MTGQAPDRRGPGRGESHCHRRRALKGAGKRHESENKAEQRGRVARALLSVLRGRPAAPVRSCQAALERRRVQRGRSSTASYTPVQDGPGSRGTGLYIGRAAAEALQAITPDEEATDHEAPVFGHSARQLGRRVDAAAKAAGLDKGFTGHSGRVGMARDLAASGVELPAMITADRWKNSRMPGRYTERQAVGRGALDWYYQKRDN